MRQTSNIKRAGLAGALFAGLLAWHAVATAHDVTYSGRATVLRATAQLLTSSTRISLADTGEIDPTGTTRDATVVSFSNPPPLAVASRTARAIASGASGTSAATAAVEKLIVSLPGLKISADVIESSTRAVCDQTTQTVKAGGGSRIVNLVINDQVITPPPRPNTKIEIPNVATVILDERRRPDVNSIVVNAIHVIVPGLPNVVKADIIVSRSESGILSCPASTTEPPPPK